MFSAYLIALALIQGVSGTTIASHSLSMENRYANQYVNDVFRHNILLTVKHMGDSFTLAPGETFAFDDKILPEYEGKISKTTNARFIGSEGYKSDGFLMGDGVCHLASVIYWTALDAGLTAKAPRSHDFANIPDVPKEYGVSIKSSDPYQNLYITNSLDKPVTFSFNLEEENLSVTATVPN